jgi:chromosome partitioning protein
VSSPKIICFANAKGGVGKTKASIAFADCLVGHFRQRALVIDTDQQASASLFMLEGDIAALRRLEAQQKTIDRYFEGVAGQTDQYPLSAFLLAKCRVFSGRDINQNTYGSLVACADRIDFVEERIVAAAAGIGPQNIGGWLEQYTSIFELISPQFKKDIIDLCSDIPHEYVIIDTAAGFRLFAMISMMISDVIIVPTVPDFASLNATFRFISQVDKYAVVNKKAIPAMHLQYTRVQPAFNTHSDYMERLRSARRAPKDDILKTPFLQRDIIAEIDSFPVRIRSFDEKYGAAAGNVKEMTREILSLLADGVAEP